MDYVCVRLNCFGHKILEKPGLNWSVELQRISFHYLRKNWSSMIFVFYVKFPKSGLRIMNNNIGVLRADIALKVQKWSWALVTSNSWIYPNFCKILQWKNRRICVTNSFFKNLLQNLQRISTKFIEIFCALINFSTTRGRRKFSICNFQFSNLFKFAWTWSNAINFDTIFIILK